MIKRIEKILDTTIARVQNVGGGCIAQTRFIETIYGKYYFLKGGFNNSMFQKEANGLNELAKARCVRVPEVIAVDNDFLLLEYIEQGNKSDRFFTDFGKAFALMHQFTSDHFGFYEDNFIGSTPQINICTKEESIDWVAFYFNKRLRFQFDLAERKGYTDKGFRNLFAQIEDKIESILKGSEEKPSLLHGDLWGGNYMVDKLGHPVLIDPAVYYGHREADLAMTKLFGGFSAGFYRSYNEHYPLKQGYEYRENIYLLYHVLNHLNLFGYSYKNQAEQLMISYL